MKWSNYNILFYSDKLGYCLFNSRMLSFSKISKETFELFSKIRDNKIMAEEALNRSDYDKLVKTKVIVTDHEDNNYLNTLKYRKTIQSYNTKSLGIILCPTLSCNFACPYCYEHNLPNNKMKEPVQDELIKFINKKSEDFQNLILNWHGGEPLMAFETIKQIYKKIEKKSKLQIGRSSMVSNGYLLSESVCKFFYEKKLDYLQITIDGSKDIHNKTRKLKNGQSSFERIIENIDMATDLMPNCCIGVRTNIGKSNREDYVQLYFELSKRWAGKNCNIYYSYVIDNSVNTCEKTRASLELTTEEKNNFEVMLAKNGIKTKKSLYPKMDFSSYTCMDRNAYVVDPKGFLYKCWADVGVKDRSIGTLESGITNYNIVSQFMIATDKFSDDKCLKCCYLPICDGGCNLYRVGNIEKGIPYNVCNINHEGLINYLETYMETYE